MARTRSIKPEFWDDEKLCKASMSARLTFIGTWTYSDDFGIVKGNPTWLKNKIFPYDAIDSETFRRWLDELEEMDTLLPFEANGESYYAIRTFKRHQSIDKPSKIRNPEPPDEIRLLLDESSAKIRRAVVDETETETETETLFAEFWKVYPSRNGKKLGRDATHKKFYEIGKGERPLVIQAAKNYASSELVRKGIGIKDPVRFLWDSINKVWYWCEWIEPEVVSVGGKGTHTPSVPSEPTVLDKIQAEQARRKEANVQESSSAQ